MAAPSLTLRWRRPGIASPHNVAPPNPSSASADSCFSLGTCQSAALFLAFLGCDREHPGGEEGGAPSVCDGWLLTSKQSCSGY
jgi:hypothetical protein